MIDSGLMGMVFKNVQHFAKIWVQQLSTFSGCMGMAFCKHSRSGEQFHNFRFCGYDLQKIFRMGILFRNLSGLMGGIFTI